PRAKKFERLRVISRAGPQDRVLDTSASGEVFLQYTFEDVYPYPERIVARGYEIGEVLSARRLYPRPRYAVFDGCSLPFADKSFARVFSTGVIENLLGQDRQAKFAGEMMRVGKSWFVTTPSYCFPFES